MARALFLSFLTYYGGFRCLGDNLICSNYPMFTSKTLTHRLTRRSYKRKLRGASVANEISVERMFM